MTATQPSSADRAAGPAVPGSDDLSAAAWELMRQFVEANSTHSELRERLGLGAGRGRIKVLFLLREQPMTLAQLADAHGVDRPYATIIVDKLEQLGFVERQPHPSDRRSKVVSLTPAGWDAAALADSIIGKPPAALRALDTGQLSELVGLLSLLSLACESPGAASWPGFGERSRERKEASAMSSSPSPDGSPPGESGPPRQPGPLGLGTRKRAYFIMMGVCLILIVLAWMVVYRYSIVAAVIMSVVALVIPPFAAIVGNAGPANRQ